MKKLRRKRRSAPDGEFKDPLGNYSPPVYADEFEHSLAEHSVLVMRTTPFKTIPPSMSIQTAMQTMANFEIACLMVVDGDKLLGVFSERDILERVAENFDRLRNEPVSKVMTRDPIVVHDSDSPAKALNLMAVGGFRHIPIVDVDENVVGILGPRRVIEYLQRHLG